MLCVMVCCCFLELSINKDLCLRVANVWPALYGSGTHTMVPVIAAGRHSRHFQKS